MSSRDLLSDRVRKKRTVAAKCVKDEEHLQIRVSSTAYCEPGELPDNPCTLQNGDPCPVCDATVEVIDRTEEVEE